MVEVSLSLMPLYPLRPSPIHSKIYVDSFYFALSKPRATIRKKRGSDPSLTFFDVHVCCGGNIN